MLRKLEVAACAPPAGVDRGARNPGIPGGRPWEERDGISRQHRSSDDAYEDASGSGGRSLGAVEPTGAWLREKEYIPTTFEIRYVDRLCPTLREGTKPPWDRQHAGKKKRNMGSGKIARNSPARIVRSRGTRLSTGRGKDDAVTRYPQYQCAGSARETQHRLADAFSGTPVEADSGSLAHPSGRPSPLTDRDYVQGE